MSWLSRIKQGLSKTSTVISSGISDIFTKRKLNAQMLEELEDLLISADIGHQTAKKIISDFAKNRFDTEVEEKEIKESLAFGIENIINKNPYKTRDVLGTKVIMFCGVNGNGKTTSIGKLTNYFKNNGKTVMMAACDTFRAAAIDQLRVWADRNDVELIEGEEYADPASVAYKAYETAKNKNIDILLIDTAGRLQTKSNLMDELAKISRVLKKIDADAPHETVLVLDATTGQNAHTQLEKFSEVVDITSIIVSKLDGTAKAGVVVALADKFNIPILAIGVGEKIDDLQPFNPRDFSRNLVDLD